MLRELTSKTNIFSFTMQTFDAGVAAYLFYEGYSYVPTKKYKEERSFRVNIQPSYVLIEDDEILKNLLNKL